MDSRELELLARAETRVRQSIEMVKRSERLSEEAAAYTRALWVRIAITRERLRRRRMSMLNRHSQHVNAAL